MRTFGAIVLLWVSSIALFAQSLSQDAESAAKNTATNYTGAPSGKTSDLTGFGNVLEGNKDTTALSPNHYTGAFMLQGFLEVDKTYAKNAKLDGSYLSTVGSASVADSLQKVDNHPMSVIVAKTMGWVRWLYFLLAFMSGILAAVGLIHRGDMSSYTARFLPWSMLTGLTSIILWLIG